MKVGDNGDGRVEDTARRLRETLVLDVTSDGRRCAPDTDADKERVRVDVVLGRAPGDFGDVTTGEVASSSPSVHWK